MKTEYFSSTPDEYGRELTNQHHRTLYYLVMNEYITPDEYHDLLDTTFVVPVKNDPSLADRFLSRFFGKETKPNSYVFPIVKVSDDPRFSRRKDTPTKPNLKVVKDGEKSVT